MTKLINSNFHEKRFPDNPKFADVHPIYKKGDRTSPGQYRPISVVTHTGKTMEKEMYDQIYTKMKGILSDKLCGYRKGFSTQHALRPRGGGKPFLSRYFRFCFYRVEDFLLFVSIYNVLYTKIDRSRAI